MAISGVLLFIIDEFFPLHTVYGPRPRPILDEIKLIHNFSNFLFLFSIGTVYMSHIYPGLIGKKKGNRISGVLSTLIILLLFISGTFLLYFSDDNLRLLAQNIHTYTGLVLVLVFSIHFIFKPSKNS